MSGPAPTPTVPDAPRGRLDALDGIRAFAVVAVLLFHAGVPGVGGGLLGVDVFFVLSGFLITSLLCGEHLTRGAIRLGRFWAGRARRLLPALFLLLVGVAVYAWAFRDSVNVSSIRGDALSTLLYVANWHFIFSHQGYFAQSAAPSPLLHMWSLGVEEQFYLAWPLVAFLVLRHRGPRLLAWVAGAGAAASALLMACMYLAGFSTDRLYYGTDTRAQALLVGAALGALASGRQWRVVAPRWAVTRAGRRAGAGLGLGGAAFLVWAWHAQNGQGAFLYEGGFLLVALAAGAVITAVTSWRSGTLATVCSLGPLTYVGRISYGLYVYHWPLFLVIDHAHTGLNGAAPVGHSPGRRPGRGRRLVSFRGATRPRRPPGPDLAGTDAGRRGCCRQRGRGGGGHAARRVRPGPGRPGGELERRCPRRSGRRWWPRMLSPPTRSVCSWWATRWPPRPRSASRWTRSSATACRLYNKGVLGCDLSVEPEPARGSGLHQPARCELRIVAVALERRRGRAAASGGRAADRPLRTGRPLLSRGQWVHVGQPAWDGQLSTRSTGPSAFSPHGAPASPSSPSPTSTPHWSNSTARRGRRTSPSRVDAWNRIEREVAATHPATVTLIDLNRMLSPDGHFTTTVDGVPVRWPGDGIHVTRAGGEWLQPMVLPEIAQLGLAAHPLSQGVLRSYGLLSAGRSAQLKARAGRGTWVAAARRTLRRAAQSSPVTGRSTLPMDRRESGRLVHSIPTSRTVKPRRWASDRASASKAHPLRCTCSNTVCATSPLQSLKPQYTSWGRGPMANRVSARNPNPTMRRRMGCWRTTCASAPTRTDRHVGAADGVFKAR